MFVWIGSHFIGGKLNDGRFHVRKTYFNMAYCIQSFSFTMVLIIALNKHCKYTHLELNCQIRGQDLNNITGTLS